MSMDKPKTFTDLATEPEPFTPENESVETLDDTPNAEVPPDLPEVDSLPPVPGEEEELEELSEEEGPEEEQLEELSADNVLSVAEVEAIEADVLDDGAFLEEGGPTQDVELPSFESDPPRDAQSLIAQLEDELPSAETPAARAAIHYAIGELREFMEGDSEHALNAYQKAYACDPTHLPTLKAAARLFKEVGRWDLVIELLEARAESSDNLWDKLDIWLEEAQLYATSLEKPIQAVLYLEKVLEIDPRHPGALALLEKTYMSAGRGDWAALTDFYARSGADERFESERAALLENLAQLEDGTPARRGEAIGTYQQLLSLDPGNLMAITALKRLLILEKRFDELAALYRHEETITADPKRQALLRYLQARLAIDRQKDPQRGMELVRAGLEIDPENALLLDELENACEQSRDFKELARIHERQLAATENTERRFDLAFKLGVLYEEELKDDAQAVRWYEQALAARPGYAPALQVLGKLYARLEWHDEHLRILELEAESAADSKLRAGKFFALAEHAERDLGDHGRAIEAYRKVLSLMPGYLPAVKAISELYQLTGRLSELIALNEDQISQTPDLSAEQFVYILEKNAALWEQLGEPARAAECRRRILGRKPEHLPSIQHLGRLYARLGDWENLVAINQREADLINDQHRIVALLCKNGDLLETRLADETRAIDYYRRVLTLAPNYLPALRSLGAIYQRLGQWEDLVRMYHRELEATGEGEAAANIRFKIAQIHEDKLGHGSKAESNYRKILEIDPNFTPALHALTRLYQKSDNYQGLVELNEQQAARATDPAARRLALFKVAELYETRINYPNKAEDAYAAILAQEPDNLAARRGLTRLYAAAGNSKRQLDLVLAELRQEQEPSRRIPLLVAAADLYGELGGHESEQFEALSEVVRLDPSQRAVFEPLKRLCLMQGRYAELAGLYEARLERAENDDEKRNWLTLLADLLENHLGDFDRLANTYRERLTIDAKNRRALDFFEDAYAREQRYAELLDIYTRLHDLSENKVQVLHLDLSMGLLCEFALDNPEGALAHYRGALALDPGFVPARHGLKRIVAQLERYGDLVELLIEDLKRGGPAPQLAATAYQLGYLYETKYAQPRKAADYYLQVLEYEPGHLDAFRRARKLFFAERDHAKVAALLEKRLAILEGPAERIALHREIADLAQNTLGDHELAIRHARAILDAEPENDAERARLADLLALQGDWRGALAFYEELAPHEKDVQALCALHLKMGRIYEAELHDKSRAVSAYETVLTYAPDDLQAMEHLAELYFEMRLADEAAELYTRLLAHELPRDKALAYNLALGRVELELREDGEKAALCFERALALDPQNEELFAKLTELFISQGNYERLVDFYEKAIDQSREDERCRDLFLKLATLYSEKIGDVAQALGTLERAARVFPDDYEIAKRQAFTLGKNALYYLDAIDKLRALLVREPFCIPCYRELHRLFVERNAIDNAFCAALALDFLRALPDDWQEPYKRLRERGQGGIAAVLSERDQERLLVHPDERGILRDIFKRIEPALSKILPVDLERHNLQACKVAGANASIYQLLENAAYHLGVDLFKVYLSNEPNVLALENTKPATIVLGGSLAFSSESIKRFVAGLVMSRIRNGHVVLQGIQPARLRFFAECACHLYLPEIVPAALDAQIDNFDDFMGKLQRNLPKQAKKDLEGAAYDYRRQAATLDFAAFANGMRYTDLRMAVLLSFDLFAAAECLAFMNDGSVYRPAADTDEVLRRHADDPQWAEILRFVVGEDHAALRKLLRLNVE